MRNLKQLAMGAVTGGLMSIGIMGMAAAQTDSTVRLDIGDVTEELGLDEETSRELAPLLERLNTAFEGRQQHWQEGDEIRDQVAEAYEDIAETLSATELREFHWMLRGTSGRAWAGSRYVDYGRMRGGRSYYGRGTPTRGYAGRGFGRWAPTSADSSFRLDIGTVAEELGLDEETSRELSPVLERLNTALDARQQHWQEGETIYDEIGDTYDSIAETLSATEMREFHWLVRGAALGSRAGRPYGRYDDGRMRGYRDRWPAARGGGGGYGRGRSMRGGRGYSGRGVPMRGSGRNYRPGWRPDVFDPQD